MPDKRDNGRVTYLFYRRPIGTQWGYSINCNSSTQRINLPISFQSDNVSLAVSITNMSPLACCDDLTRTDFRYRGNDSPLPNLRWIAIGK
ncbi:gp53-like domain-containing protein [Megasphaera jansseni]